jgi:hypothetical protein
MNITGFNDRITLAPVLMNAGVIATTDQTTATKDRFSVAIVGRVADGGGQTGHLDVAETFEFGPNW